MTKEETDRKKQQPVVMDISSLKEGTSVKSYSELCGLLKMDKMGNKHSRDKQLKELNRYVEFEREGRTGYRIMKIRDAVIQKEDKRRNGNNSIYQEKFEYLLLSYLVNRLNGGGYNFVDLTTKKILNITGMVNSAYLYENIGNFIVENYDRIDDAAIDEFYRRARSKLYSNVTSILEYLEKGKKLITVRKTYKIKKNGFFVLATEDEEIDIRHIEYLAMHKVGDYTTRDGILVECKDITYIYTTGLQYAYYNMCNKLILDLYGSSRGWEAVYKTYKIGFGENIKTEREKYKKNIEEARKNKLEMNTVVVNAFETSIKKYCQKHTPEYTIRTIDEIENDDDLFGGYNPSEVYYYKQKLLTDIFISLDGNPITDDYYAEAFALWEKKQQEEKKINSNWD